MNFHIRDEVLSAYLDGEVESGRERSIENHVASCLTCRKRLAGMRGIALELRRAPRLAPPPDLAEQVRRRAMQQPLPGTFEGLWTFLAGLPFQPATRTLMAMGLALAIGVSLFGIEREERPGLFRTAPPALDEKEAVPNVTVSMGPEPAMTDVQRPTTSRVANRDFVVLSEVFVQEGLEGSEPESRVDMRSPEGRAVLTKLPGISLFLEAGYRVVLRYNWETVELSPSPHRQPVPRPAIRSDAPLRGASLGWPGVRV
jgi:hypothetical protein